MPELKHDYPKVKNADRISYGGSQTWADSKSIERCGCGLVASADLLLYLHRWHFDGDAAPEISASWPIERGQYEKLMKRLERYMPIIPPFGMTGFGLAIGLNLYFARYKMPYRIRWGVPAEKLWQRIEEMLSKDIPVILAIGPNFPIIWQKNRVPFYIRTQGGEYVKQSSAKSHYVSVTGMDGEYLRISSWGRMYYVRRSEYEEYAKAHSNYLVTNIGYVTKKEALPNDKN